LWAGLLVAVLVLLHGMFTAGRAHVPVLDPDRCAAQARMVAPPAPDEDCCATHVVAAPYEGSAHLADEPAAAECAAGPVRPRGHAAPAAAGACAKAVEVLPADPIAFAPPALVTARAPEAAGDPLPVLGAVLRC
jgi:hypothetical protein